jgi:hypothetical protein
MIGLRLSAAPAPGISGRTRESGRSQRHARRWLLEGGGLAGGAMLTVLALLGAAAPVSARTLTWSVVPSPNQNASNNQLNGVSCTSAAACTAVGSYDNSGIYQTLIESWNGTGWSVVPSPGPGSGIGALDAVSCTSAAACTAVGSYDNNSDTSLSLIESWNGANWSVVPSPSPGSIYSFLEGVSCISATACTAVGSYNISPGTYRTLIESWDGISWSEVPSPSLGHYDNLNGVSCTSAAACTAVGYYVGKSHLARPLIESWNGTSWSTAPSSSPGAGASYLTGVSCTSAATCTAVGYYALAHGNDKTLIESWNGTRWSAKHSPNRGNGNNQLHSVSCTSAAACTAVGGCYDSSYYNRPNRTLIETWNGTRWSAVSSPSPGSYNDLWSVSCAPAAACAAAGYSYRNSGTDRTLTESAAAIG